MIIFWPCRTYWSDEGQTLAAQSIVLPALRYSQIDELGEEDDNSHVYAQVRIGREHIKGGAHWPFCYRGMSTRKSAAESKNNHGNAVLFY